MWDANRADALLTDDMKRLIILLAVFIPLAGSADPGKRIERKKNRIDKQHNRKLNPFDERTQEQKKKDKRSLIGIATIGVLIMVVMKQSSD